MGILSSLKEMLLPNNGDVIPRADIKTINLALESEICERKRAQEKLQLSEARYRGLIDNMQIALLFLKAIINEHGVVEDLEYLQANPAFENVVRLKRSDVLGKRITEVFPEIHKEKEDWVAILGEVALTDKAASIEHYSLALGRWYHINAYSHEYGVVAVTVADITADRLAAEALRESKELYEKLIHQAAEAIVLVDFSSGGIVEINNAFTQMFGYTAEQAAQSDLVGLGLLSDSELTDLDGTLFQTGGNHSDIRQYNSCDGRVIYAVRSVTSIQHCGKQMVMLSYRDITEQQKLQAVLQSQVELAGKAQKSLLAADFDDSRVSIKTIFEPLTLVSGDFFGYRWSHDGTTLHGYLIDITGHGIATALHTSAFSSLLNEVMDHEEVWTEAALKQLNSQLSNYSKSNTFAGLITFSLDLKKRRITCSSGGINYLLASTAEKTGLVRIPGIYLGVTRNPEFGTVTFPVQYGDTFYFVTDGISDRLTDEIIGNIGLFEETCAALNELSKSSQAMDDCSALCIQIRGARQFPVRFSFASSAERRLIDVRLSRILAAVTGQENSKVQVALGEAIANAAEFGTKVKIKINLIGSRLVMRVCHNGGEFDGNEKVRKILGQGLDVLFETLFVSQDERGRGIPIMLVWTDKVIYSKRGNEVMLIKNIR